MFLLATGCRQQKSPSYLNEERMTELLYDLHLAQAILQTTPSDSVAYYQTLYQQAILDKYGLDEKGLKENVLYYISHAKTLSKMYNTLNQRMQADCGMGGGEAFYSSTGDTVNIWKAPSQLLMVAGGANSYAYTISTDTLVAPGDNLELRLMASHIYPEGERNAYVSVHLQYVDSVATVTQKLGGVGMQNMAIPVSATRQLQRLKVTFLQNTTWGDGARILSYKNIHLLRMRARRVVSHEANDSIVASSDSLRRDSVKTGR